MARESAGRASPTRRAAVAAFGGLPEEFRQGRIVTRAAAREGVETPSGWCREEQQAQPSRGRAPDAQSRHQSCSKTAFTFPVRTARARAAWSFSFWSA